MNIRDATRVAFLYGGYISRQFDDQGTMLFVRIGSKCRSSGLPKLFLYADGVKVYSGKRFAPTAYDLICDDWIVFPSIGREAISSAGGISRAASRRMNICEAAEAALACDGYLVHPDKTEYGGGYYVKPTDSKACSFIWHMLGNGELIVPPSPRWNPEAWVLMSDRWDFVEKIPCTSIYEYRNNVRRPVK